MTRSRVVALAGLVLLLVATYAWPRKVVVAPRDRAAPDPAPTDENPERPVIVAAPEPAETLPSEDPAEPAGLRFECELPADFVSDEHIPWVRVSSSTSTSGEARSHHALATVEGGVLAAFLPEDTRSAVISVEGQGRFELVWGDDGCSAALLESNETGLFGTVREESGEPAARVRVRACGRAGRSDADGEFYMEVESGACDAWAERTNGAAKAIGPIVAFEAHVGVDANIELVAPAAPAFESAPPMSAELREKMAQMLALHPSWEKKIIANVKVGALTEQQADEIRARADQLRSEE